MMIMTTTMIISVHVVMMITMMLQVVMWTMIKKIILFVINITGMTICSRPLFQWFRKEVVMDNISLNDNEDGEHENQH